LSGFITRLKEPAGVIAVIVGIVSMFGAGFFAGAHWYVSSEVSPLRKEVTVLSKHIEDSRNKISNNGERLAKLEATLLSASSRIDRVGVRVTKNTDSITDLRVSIGTPGP